ncbi:hypothetical protein G3I28_02280, partial [Streptomyces sp. SID10116]|nr:hypothetical protein [Streptomyces sp. SID10116]
VPRRGQQPGRPAAPQHQNQQQQQNQQQDQGNNFAPQQGGRENPDYTVPRPPAPRRGQGDPNQGLPQQQGQGQGVGQAPQQDRLNQQQDPLTQHEDPLNPQQPLPPGGPDDGRTPLFDTLETNWFQQQQNPQSQHAAQQPAQQDQQEHRNEHRNRQPARQDQQHGGTAADAGPRQAPESARHQAPEMPQRPL